MSGKPTKLAAGGPSVVKTFRFGADELDRLEALTKHFAANLPPGHRGPWTSGDSVREALYLACVWLELEEEQTPTTPAPPASSTPARSTPAPPARSTPAPPAPPASSAPARSTPAPPAPPASSAPTRSTPAPPVTPAALSTKRLYEVMGQLADDEGMVPIPELVRALRPALTEEVHALLRKENSAESRRIELRPEANPQNVPVEDRKLVMWFLGAMYALARDARADG